MSLRARLVAAIVLALLLSFGAGAGVAAWQAVRSVRTELESGLAGARVSASAALAAASADGRMDASALRRIVSTYDGNRHIRVELLDGGHHVIAASRAATAGMPPRWFLASVAPVLAPVVLAAGGGSLVLSADAANESFERWSALRDLAGLLALFCVMAAALCSVTAGRALQKLTSLSHGLARLGSGDRDVRIPAGGPPEIAALADSFNTLSAALQIARDQNLQLQMQAALLADEERAEIARDLHDEVGPLLFAITAFTATIGRLVEERDLARIPPQLQSIQEAISAIQLDVRDMLGRLHDVSPQSACLADSLAGLLAFWRKVQPALTFELHLDAGCGALTGHIADVLYRVAQESLSNAVRHGCPLRVAVRAELSGNNVVLSITDDGQGGTEAPGHGLTGMRARVAAYGGRLDIAHGMGWTVTATLKLPSDGPAAQPAMRRWQEAGAA